VLSSIGVLGCQQAGMLGVRLVPRHKPMSLTPEQRELQLGARLPAGRPA